MSDEKPPELSFPGIKLDAHSLQKRKMADEIKYQLDVADAVRNGGHTFSDVQRAAYDKLKREYERVDREALNV